MIGILFKLRDVWVYGSDISAFEEDILWDLEGSNEYFCGAGKGRWGYADMIIAGASDEEINFLCKTAWNSFEIWITALYLQLSLFHSYRLWSKFK